MAVLLSPNQFALVPVVGHLDLQTMSSGVITVKVDASQGTALKCGQFVKFYASNTGPFPTVVAAGQTDNPNGIIIYNTKQSTFNAGDKMEISFFGGNVIYLQATATAIVPGAAVESDATGLLIQLSGGTNQVRGWALDYIPASGVGRVIQSGIKQAV